LVIALRYLLDTDICIYIKRINPLVVRQRLARQAPGTVGMSVISWGELMYGAQQSRSPHQAIQALEDLATYIPVIGLPRNAGECFGEMHARLVRSGTMIGTNDLWIASHALAENLVLVTNNEREFRRVPGLKVENWVTGA
jgi:tRNA(fMet)-specific endonuclease VapC